MTVPGAPTGHRLLFHLPNMVDSLGPSPCKTRLSTLPDDVYRHQLARVLDLPSSANVKRVGEGPHDSTPHFNPFVVRISKQEMAHIQISSITAPQGQKFCPFGFVEVYPYQMDLSGLMQKVENYALLYGQNDWQKKIDPSRIRFHWLILVEKVSRNVVFP